MAFAAGAFVPALVPVSSMCSNRASSSKSWRNYCRNKQRKDRPLGNFGHFAEVVRRDVEFLKRGFSRGIERAGEVLRISQLSRTLDDVLWLRHLEDADAPRFQFPSWPHPCYPELSGMDLLLADLKAFEAYASYFYYLSKMRTRPLPDVYDPQEVADYFSHRPHVVALRLLEVFASFSSAVIRIRTLGISKIIWSRVDNEIDKNISQYDFGMVLKQTLLNLGPTFIKVGQSLSTRPDIIGSEMSKALSELHEQIPPFPRTVAMKIIEEELGSPLGTFFSYISEEPVAGASFGQVYRGRTIDGVDVAIKVQRPHMHHVVVRDIYILRLGLGLLKKIAKRKSDPRLYADELGKGFVGELDYTLEAENASEFMKAHSPFSFIHVPKILRHLSRKRVLTMEWIAGESPSDLISITTKELTSCNSTYVEKWPNDARRRLLDLVNKGVEASLVQLLETGLLHADPHPGNLRYTSSGKIGFLDFGLLCRMEKRHQLAMLASIVHIVNGDWASLVHALIEMDVVRPGTNIRVVTKDLENALGVVEFKDGIPDVKFSRVLGKIWTVALKYHFRMPPYYTLLLRSLASLEGLAVAADPNFKTFEAAYPYVAQKLLTDNSSASRRILHSVVLNKRREFQWQRLSLFLRVGTTRKGLHSLLASSSESPNPYSSIGKKGVFDVAKLVLRLLPSKDGVALRRLLMTADGASLMRAMVSKEATPFRQDLCRSIADILYQWMSEAFRGVTISKYRSQVKVRSAADEASLYYQSILRDRRLKLIFFKVMDSARKDRILMLRFYWTSFVMFVTASALACHRALVVLSEAYLGPIQFAPKRFAISG